MRFWNRWVLGLSAVAALTAGCGAGADVATTTGEATRGAAFTTFDRTLDGCSPGSPNGVNCNHYVCQDRVFINGGPNRAHGRNVLEDGHYYFAVIAPGHQNGGAADGADGNLSFSATNTIDDRRFAMIDGQLVYPDPDAIPQPTNLHVHTDSSNSIASPNGQPIVGVAPFAVTPNPGGVYILAVCPIRDGVASSSPADCKFDAFKSDTCPSQCQQVCPESDWSCVPCPQTCDPTCVTDTWGGTSTNCIPCPPTVCDPTCDPLSCASCTPCIW